MICSARLAGLELGMKWLLLAILERDLSQVSRSFAAVIRQLPTQLGGRPRWLDCDCQEGTTCTEVQFRGVQGEP